MAGIQINTPKDSLVQVKTGSNMAAVKLSWKSSFGSEKTESYRKAQMFLDNEVLRLCDPLVPFRTGGLKKSGILGTRIGSGEVRYIAPYARRMYYGKVMVGKPPMKTTNTPMTYQGAPRRGAFWFERMKAEKKDAILRGAAAIAGRG